MADNKFTICPDIALENSGIEFERLAFETLHPACCSEGCMVEPDGKCEHGNNAVMIEWEII